MAYATALTSPISQRKDGFRYTAEPCCDTVPKASRQWWDVCPRPEQDLCLEEGEFQLNGPHGTRRIARFTGRKRWINSKTYAPTIEVFDIATVVEMVGELPVIVGRRGERLKGTWWVASQAVNPQAVKFK
jgi:hypothetical protein